MDPKEAVIPDLLNREVDILRDILTPKVKRELGETKTECKMQRGSCHKHPRETNRVFLATSTSAAIMILPVQSKLSNL